MTNILFDNIMRKVFEILEFTADKSGSQEQASLVNLEKRNILDNFKFHGKSGNFGSIFSWLQYMSIWATGYKPPPPPKKYCISFSEDRTVQTLMRCRILLHFIWVYNVCQSTHLEVSGTQSQG